MHTLYIYIYTFILYIYSVRRPICNLSLVLLIYRPTESVLCTHAYGTWYFYFIITIFFTCSRRLGKQIKNGHALPCTATIEETETGFVDDDNPGIFFNFSPPSPNVWMLYPFCLYRSPFSSSLCPTYSARCLSAKFTLKKKKNTYKRKENDKKRIISFDEKIVWNKKIPIAFCLIYDLRTTDDSWMPSPPTRIILFFALKQVPFCCFFTRFAAYRCCKPKDRFFFFYYYFPRHNSPRKYVYNVYTWADAMTLKTLRALSLPIIVGFFQLVTRSTTAILCSIRLLAFSIRWL